MNYPDGLTAGSLAYALKAPVLLASSKSFSAAVSYTNALSVSSGYVLGGNTLVSDDAVIAIFSLASADEIILVK